MLLLLLLVWGSLFDMLLNVDCVPLNYVEVCLLLPQNVTLVGNIVVANETSYDEIILE